ncbi:hypothetical protein [Haloferula sp.]|uniref:hypothetical protein n=1 Tax=Haloferula sp. TaxID=2497595 RepID=UPI0032A07058
MLKPADAVALRVRTGGGKNQIGVAVSGKGGNECSIRSMHELRSSDGGLELSDLGQAVLSVRRRMRQR